MSKELKYSTWSSVFIAYKKSHKKKIAPSRDLSSGHPLQEAIEVLHTTLDENDHFLLHAWNFLCIRTPQSGVVGVIGLNPPTNSLLYWST
jgi:hypothetical protein